MPNLHAGGKPTFRQPTNGFSLHSQCYRTRRNIYVQEMDDARELTAAWNWEEMLMPASEEMTIRLEEALGRWWWWCQFSWYIHLKFLFEEYYGEQIWPKRHNLTDNGTSYKLPQWRLAQEFSLEEFQQWKFQHHTPFLENKKKFSARIVLFCSISQFTSHMQKCSSVPKCED
jgi:hypothetical protein